MTFNKNPFLFILAGAPTYDKILLFYTLIFYADTIYLAGEIGIQYYLWKEKKTEIGLHRPNLQFQKLWESIEKEIEKE